MNGRASAVISLIFLSACVPPRPARPAAKPDLLNPLLSAEPGLKFEELRPFDFKIRQYVEDAKKAGLATHVSVYFRDLENGPVFSVGMDELYSPASLMKVPLMMATLKEAEKNPGLLSRRVKNDQPILGLSDFDEHPLKRGEEYSVDELLRAMIAYSDNDAVVMLRTVVGDGPLNDVFRDFGMLIPEVRTLDDSMSAREYSAFFRILYNASYLNRAMSQRALEYLSASKFKDALVAGVPAGVTVAHKFGERSFDDKPTKQLHDCGIVYHPTENYVLCVMTRGDDFAKLGGVIRDISSMIYKEVDAQQKR
jgi:beta-lactamase class A